MEYRRTASNLHPPVTISLRSGETAAPWYEPAYEQIARTCNIHKKLTTHVARRTFSTLMLTKGVSTENVFKMLGHTDIRTT